MRNWILDRLSAEQVETTENLICFDRGQFVVRFDSLEKLLGYSQGDFSVAARQTMLSEIDYIEGDDESLLLTMEAATVLVVCSSQPDKARILGFFKDVNTAVQDYRQLQNMVEQNITIFEHHSRHCLDKHKRGQPVFYLVLVDECDGKYILKAGSSDDLPARYNALRATYPFCYVRKVIEIGCNRALEDDFHKHEVCRMFNTHRTYKGANHRELYLLDGDRFTEEKAYRIACKLAEGLCTKEEARFRHEEKMVELQIKLMERQVELAKIYASVGVTGKAFTEAIGSAKMVCTAAEQPVPNPESTSPGSDIQDAGVVSDFQRECLTRVMRDGVPSKYRVIETKETRRRFEVWYKKKHGVHDPWEEMWKREFQSLGKHKAFSFDRASTFIERLGYDPSTKWIQGWAGWQWSPEPQASPAVPETSGAK
jgi:hypothetical protein